jgi:hypothetical protein
MRFQFRLKTLLCVISLLAVLAAGVTWWRWWTYTRYMRALSDTISVSALNADTKLLMKKLAWNSAAWDDGLIHNLIGPASFKQVVWKSNTHCGHDIYICDAFVRPVARTPIPPVCLIVDDHHNIVTWAIVAPYSYGFLDANLDNQDILTVTTRANWFFGTGVYRYTILCNSITPVDEGIFTKFNDDVEVTDLPTLKPDDPALDGIIHSRKCSGI